MLPGVLRAQRDLNPALALMYERNIYLFRFIENNQCNAYDMNIHKVLFSFKIFSDNNYVIYVLIKGIINVPFFL